MKKLSKTSFLRQESIHLNKMKFFQNPAPRTFSEEPSPDKREDNSNDKIEDPPAIVRIISGFLGKYFCDRKSLKSKLNGDAETERHELPQENIKRVCSKKTKGVSYGFNKREITSLKAHGNTDYNVASKKGTDYKSGAFSYSLFPISACVNRLKPRTVR